MLLFLDACDYLRRIFSRIDTYILRQYVRIVMSCETLFFKTFLFCLNSFVLECKIKHERAAGTILVIATSSPELCISYVSAFITDGDIGIGTIVGSSVFNILAVTACCGLFAQSVIKVDVYLLSRDCIFYALSIIGLIAVIYDQLIMWYEAVLMITGYGVYLISKY